MFNIADLIEISQEDLPKAVADPGVNPAMAPIEVGNGVCPPLEEERIMRVV